MRQGQARDKVAKSGVGEGGMREGVDVTDEVEVVVVEVKDDAGPNVGRTRKRVGSHNGDQSKKV